MSAKSIFHDFTGMLFFVFFLHEFCSLYAICKALLLEIMHIAMINYLY